MKAKKLALLPARAALGATMLHHGASKLRGDGARQAAEFFEGMGFRPGRTWATLAGAAEVFAGATALLGIGTRLGALAVIGTQAVAIAKVHRGKGFDNVAGGYEFNLALIAMSLALLGRGPGALSGHALVRSRMKRRPAGFLPRARPSAALRAAAAIG